MNRSTGISKTTGRRQKRGLLSRLFLPRPSLLAPSPSRLSRPGPSSLAPSPSRHQTRGLLSRLLRRKRIANYWGHTQRKGSVLLVVLGLLLLLMVLGFTFFTFSSQENTSAEYYADSAKVFTITVDADVLWDFALEQLILGPPDTYRQSALWPGRHALVPNMMGMFTTNSIGFPLPDDRHLNNGTGFNVISDTFGQPFVDQDFDGNGDTGTVPSDLLLSINYSQAINPNTGALYNNRAQVASNFPTIDAGYTYPDLNNVFLAYIGTDYESGKRVLIPSFHRPAYLRQGGVTIADWYENNTLLDSQSNQPLVPGMVMRPHRNHVNFADVTFKRFLSFPITVGVRTIQAFPFRVDTNADGIYGAMGVWSDTTQPNVNEYDVNNDNLNGDPEAIWLDLGFPPQLMPDGRSYTPLFAFTVIDADGLVNVNAHGNLANLSSFADITNAIAGGSPISKSNQGLSSAEVNPFWVLNANPQNSTWLSPPISNGYSPSVLQDYRVFFGLDNTNFAPPPNGYNIDRVSMANMELLFMMMGRAKYGVTVAGSGFETRGAITDLFEGRWGDKQRLFNGANLAPFMPASPFPAPGVWQSDDDFDQYAGTNGNDYQTFPFLANPGLLIRGYGHPLDNSGRGYDVITFNYGSGNERLPVLVSDPSQPLNQAAVWKQYNGYMGNTNYLGSFTGYPNYLAQNQNTSGMLDEGDETIADRRFQVGFGGNDKVFGPEELAFLQMSDGDFTKITGSSRLKQLMSFNLSSNIEAPNIRKRLTTDSFDRREHAFAYCNYPPSIGSTVPRGQWEYGGDWDGNGFINEFPPTVTLSGSAVQPFRQEVAAVIGAKQKFASDPENTPGFAYALWNKQLRMKLNRLLTTPVPSNAMAIGNAPFYRHLIPHPTLLGGSDAVPIPGSPGGVAAPTILNFAIDSPDQEYWARNDRQKMARDIYVMLYMFGGSNDTVNYATKPNTITSAGPPVLRAVYHDWQLKEMAQFAVNYVDAVDRDDVITRFEYDKDLSDGWNLGDNPYTTADDTAVADRGVVYGVEAQGLTLSEALCIRQAAIASDITATAYNDTSSDRFWTYIELKNVGEKQVNLTNGNANSQWRVRMQRPGAALPGDQSIVLQRDGLNNRSYIPPGGQLTIGSVGRNDGEIDTFSTGMITATRSADFRIDTNGDNVFDLVVPAIASDPGQAPTVDVPPNSNIDLVHNRDYNFGVFQLVQHSTTAAVGNPPPQTGTDATSSGSVRGNFGQFSIVNGSPLDTLVFTLERRVNLYRTAPPVLNAVTVANTQQNDDNPWVVVDVLQNSLGANRPQIMNFPVTAASTGASILATDLPQLLSTERPRPLDRSSTNKHIPTATPAGSRFYNTIGQAVNSNLSPTDANVVWQPHFDRDLASVVELLSLPLYGPDEVTARLAYNGRLVPEVLTPTYQPNVASAKFFQSYNSNQTIHNNRWYRILELLEFPTRANKQVEDYYQTQLLRVPGKINPNGIRHAETLMALLDDPAQFNMTTRQDTLEAARDWAFQFVVARDGRDRSTQMVLPGSPASRPFRDFSQATAPLASAPLVNPHAVERTLFRRLPYDNEDANDNNTLDPGEDANNDASLFKNTNGTRRLFEARSNNDLTNNYVDYHTRNRLLAKVANNSTPRSNVFAVWVTVGFFDTYLPPGAAPGVTQIGAEMTDQDRRRGFFVVDRSLLEDAYNQQTGTFDYRKFIQYRKTIE